MFPVPLGWLHRPQTGKADRICGAIPEIETSNAEPFGLAIPNSGSSRACGPARRG
ncbi:hypothetical protein CES86_3037 [Brucella lupini]|uniref:Uncharacterized protein n=1 Tax=Brucella lupini TaxID=255457 RepID=A0A256GLS9_9HYPH|nr:hypothetical protein CES86_3037 [Brucella lupini]